MLQYFSALDEQNIILLPFWYVTIYSTETKIAISIIGLTLFAKSHQAF